MDSTTATAVLLATVLTVGLAGAAVGFGAVGAQEAPTPDDRPAQVDERSITVAGQGAPEAPPDQAVVAVAVVAEGDDLATGADALWAALANASVADERVDTTEFSVAEQRRSPYETPGGPDAPEAPAYLGVHAFEVTLDDVDRGFGPAGAEEALSADGGGATDLRPGDAAVRVDVRVTYDATANGSARSTAATVSG